jgi:hypothetical protein
MIALKVMKTHPGIWNTVDQCRAWVYSIADRLDLTIRRKTHNQTVIQDEEEIGEIHLDFVNHVRTLMEFHEGEHINL